MRVSQSFPIPLPKTRIDLFRWLTEMTPSDYESYSPAHRAMGSFFDTSGQFHMVNVELIGNEMLIQHYALRDHSADRLTLYSEKTKAYVWRWFPAVVGVPWELSLRDVDPDNCELTCTIGADFPSHIIALGAYLNGFGGIFIRKHLAQEGAAFAKDILKKFGP
jgi:hypothetical protein